MEAIKKTGRKKMSPALQFIDICVDTVLANRSIKGFYDKTSE